MAEWLMALVLKTSVGLCPTGGSNPSPSVYFDGKPVIFPLHDSLPQLTQFYGTTATDKTNSKYPSYQ